MGQKHYSKIKKCFLSDYGTVSVHDM